ncbi:unnamed protein product [Litomosoides sigmodontis]|uniref:Leishmanolysin-like peptidase n=1 Tax=Litomosoides sigmodontis TaxID=42156 RepID=A0A3P6TM61_LITSI|nr:unnamed protein product [Litomosoides sigmodontis]
MIFLTIILTTSGATCSYKVPNVDDIVFDVPLDYMESDREDGSGRFRKTRDVNDVNVDNSVFRPLRIHLHYDRISIGKLMKSIQYFVNTSLLPEAVNYWQNALAVRPTATPIRLNRQINFIKKCVSNLYYMRLYEKRQSCVLGCKKETSCGEVIIPDEHLYQCRYCTSQESQNCGITGPPDGVGVPNTDFLLYVSAVLPIAGHVNLCPNALSIALHDREVLLSTVKHEILHALGFSAGLYAFFRDDNGNPRTRRNRYNKPISLNKDRGYYNWDPSTIQTIVRNDWWTAEGMAPHPVHIMVTPRVQQEARWHFNCMDLEGAELENQGGDGTALTHWEKRLFENEAMTGTHTQNPVYSRLTFALLEDSGWYKANYSAAEELHWGHHLGCEFAKKSCGEWIRNRREKNLLLAPFCDEIKHDGKRSLATTRCTAQRDSLALCNLEFEWKAPNSSGRRDSRCELDGNFSPGQANSMLEVYGSRSKCFDFATLWTERKCGRIRTFLQYKAGCYQYECSEGRLNIALFNESFFYPCYFTGQYVHIRKPSTCNMGLFFHTSRNHCFEASGESHLETAGVP